jgi:DegV family protein with EDD domain
MQIVVDRGMDIHENQLDGMLVHYAPLRITLGEKSYVSGVDIQSDEFYIMLAETSLLPTTSQPSAGEFAQLYRKLAEKDADILSIHISSGLSGTYNAARGGAEMTPEARVTFIDSKTLSCPFGWQVEAAVKAIRRGWAIQQVIELVEKVQQSTHAFFTLADLKYLIHGGRISHMKGLIASALKIKPVITVDHEFGKYVNVGQEFTLKRAISKMADTVAGLFPGTNHLRVQMMHGHNPEGVDVLRNFLAERFQIDWLPTVPVGAVLGAHTGPSLVGLSVCPAGLFAPI